MLILYLFWGLPAVMSWVLLAIDTVVYGEVHEDYMTRRELALVLAVSLIPCANWLLFYVMWVTVVPQITNSVIEELNS